jgi:hypothetical protein
VNCKKVVGDCPGIPAAILLLVAAGGCDHGFPSDGLGTRTAAAVASPAQIVYPTGDPSIDIANVQAAIDEGGTVLLKSTNQVGVPTSFDFGHPPSRICRAC